MNVKEKKKLIKKRWSSARKKFEEDSEIISKANATLPFVLACGAIGLVVILLVVFFMGILFN